MSEALQANWLIFAGALVVALGVAWWLFGRAATPRVREHRPDVLDEGAAPAQRNQALIDAPPAAQIITPPPMAGVLGGIGEIVAVAAQDEVEEAEAEAEVAPPPPPPPATPVAQGDDLSRIKGLGPKLQALLPTLGITRYAEIAAMSDTDLAELDSKLGAFAGRPARDQWVEQAKLLAADDTAGYEAKFGKL